MCSRKRCSTTASDVSPTTRVNQAATCSTPEGVPGCKDSYNCGQRQSHTTGRWCVSGLRGIMSMLCTNTRTCSTATRRRHTGQARTVLFMESAIAITVPFRRCCNPVRNWFSRSTSVAMDVQAS